MLTLATDILFYGVHHRLADRERAVPALPRKFCIGFSLLVDPFG